MPQNEAKEMEDSRPNGWTSVYLPCQKQQALDHCVYCANNVFFKTQEYYLKRA